MNTIIETLVSGKPATIEEHVLRFEQRNMRLLVVICHEPNAPMDWIEDACEQAGFSTLYVAGPVEKSAKLEKFFKALGQRNEVKAFDGIAICAKERSVEQVFQLAPYLPRAIMLLAELPDKTTPIKKDAKKLCENLKAGYVIHDPLSTPLHEMKEVLSSGNITFVKCFGLGQNCLTGLKRMHLLEMIRISALRGELDEQLFYERLRIRKNYPLYRKAIEAVLDAKGQRARMIAFREAFRNRLAQTGSIANAERLQRVAEERLPSNIGSWLGAVDKAAKTRWPSAGGNIWMLDAGPDSLRYMSDRWEGRVIGYEEREGVTLAQTPPLAHGFVAFGGEAQIPRPLSRRFRWHVVDETLDGTGVALAPMAEATIANTRRDITRDTLVTIAAVTQSQPGATPSDTKPEAAPYKSFLARVKQAEQNLRAQGKRFSVERLRLGLLRGALDISETEAARTYFEDATRMAQDLAKITGQTGLPLIVVTQGAGLRNRGDIEALLAEGAFDIRNVGLNCVVATPTYPFPIMDDTQGTLRPEAALLVDELCDLAVTARQSGKWWYCPSLRLTKLSGREILAEFSAMNGLVLDDGQHGFKLEGVGSLPTITRAEVVADRTVRLELSSEPGANAVALSYAWGHRETREGFAANHGGLRDAWEQESALQSGRMLYRFALSGRVPLLRAN